MTPTCEDGFVSGATILFGNSADVQLALSDATTQLLDVDPAGLDDESLHELVVRLQAERSRLAVAASELLAEWESRRLWESDGSRSPAHRLARETRASVRTASDEITRARKIRLLPATRDAVVAGRLSIDHVDLLGRANTPERRALFERDEETLIEQCARLRFSEAARVVRYWTARADDELATAGPAAGADRQPSVSRLYCSTTLDDTVVVDGVFVPIDGSIIDNELNRIAEQIRLADLAAGIDRTPAERRAAALVEMAKRSASTPANGRRPKPLYTVLIGATEFERLCELANGTITRPEMLLPDLDDALIESVLFDGPSTVISVSSKRTFTGALRRAIQVRDRRCRHKSGCDVPAELCDIDHVVPYSRGGPTSQFNGRPLCRPQNRDPVKRDHDPQPLPARPVDVLDEIRARLRWRYRNDPFDGTVSAD